MYGHNDGLELFEGYFFVLVLFHKRHDVLNPLQQGCAFVDNERHFVFGEVSLIDDFDVVDCLELAQQLYILPQPFLFFKQIC